MTAWTRARRPRLCGGPHAQPHYIAVGDPMHESTLTLPNGEQLTFVRCQHCEGPAPPDLPATTVRETAEQASVREAAAVVFGRIHRRHLAESMPLLVEREPGEEG